MMFVSIIWKTQLWLIFTVLSNLAFAQLKITIEPPDSILPNATMRSHACEYFDALVPGFKDSPFTTTFPTNVDSVRGTYENLLVAEAQWFGKVNYAAVEPGSKTVLRLTRPGFDGIDFFGAWVLAIKPGNAIEFRFKGERIRRVVHSDLLKLILDNRHLGKYDRRFPGRPDAYLNFNCENCMFDEVIFSHEKTEEPATSKRKKKQENGVEIVPQIDVSDILATDHHCVEVWKQPQQVREELQTPKQPQILEVIQRLLQGIEVVETVAEPEASKIETRVSDTTGVTPLFAGGISIVILGLLAMVVGGLYALHQRPHTSEKSLAFVDATLAKDEDLVEVESAKGENVETQSQA